MAEKTDEDWFYDSIFRYKKLNMFELEYAVQNLELVGESSVCVSCSDGRRNQLLKLSLPATLAPGDPPGAVTNDNDLKIVCGAFCQPAVVDMKVAGGEVVLASHVNSKSLSTYKLNMEDSDEMKLLVTWECELTSPRLSVGGDDVVISERACDPAFVVDLKTGKQTGRIAPEERDPTGTVTPVHLDSRTVGLCHRHSGRGDFYDTRQLQAKMGCIRQQSEKLESWSFTSLYESSSCPDHRVAAISNQGRLRVFDRRRPDSPILDEKTGLSATGPTSTARLRLEPTGRASVSGLDANVYVLELRPESEPVFTHDGHSHAEGSSSVAVTTGHAWLADAVVSAADNGTVQAWRFEDRRTDDS